jgi:hypothetical protein
MVTSGSGFGDMVLLLGREILAPPDQYKTGELVTVKTTG